MPRKPPRPERFDLSDMTGDAALEAAFDRVDANTQMLLIANRFDQPTGFGAIILRSEIPFYLGIASAIAKAITDPDDSLANRLVIMMGGGVEQRDEDIVIGLILGVANEFLRMDNMTPDQIVGAHVLLHLKDLECDLFPMPTH